MNIRSEELAEQILAGCPSVYLVIGNIHLPLEDTFVYSERKNIHLPQETFQRIVAEQHLVVEHASRTDGVYACEYRAPIAGIHIYMLSDDDHLYE